MLDESSTSDRILAAGGPRRPKLRKYTEQNPTPNTCIYRGVERKPPRWVTSLVFQGPQLSPGSGTTRLVIIINNEASEHGGDHHTHLFDSSHCQGR